jgi:hypothetical protein
MASTTNFEEVFEHLRGILKRFEHLLDVQTDSDRIYYLNSKVIGKNKKPVCFAWAQINKNYVSYHLMPVYGCPKLLENQSPELKARMQGKACFNFTAVDPELFKELAQVTKAGFDVFKKIGYI